MISVRLYTETDRERWEAFVAGAASATCYHRIGWKRVMERSFGTATSYVYAQNAAGEILGVLPLALLSSVPFGRFLVSLPFFNYGGVCANDADTRQRLIGRAVEIARRVNAQHLELRHTEPDPGLPEKARKASMRLALPATSDELWNSFPSDLRRKVRRPLKDGITARVERPASVDDFYKVFTVNMRDLGTPVYAKSFFANMLEEFPESTWICSVYRGSEPLASGFLVGFRDRLEIPWVSSLRAYNHLYTNMLLYWTALRFACDSGYKVFDFGRSTIGGGTYRFKAQWGAQPTPLYWHYWTRNGAAVPELNPENPRYSMAIRLWKRLPLRVTTFLGPAIVRSLP